jgi:glycogen synthase
LKPDTILYEIAWEVCNQVGGIYTYLKSKIPTMLDYWGEQYTLIGPYFPKEARLDFRPVPESPGSPLCKTMESLRNQGFDVQYGHWLIAGIRVKVVLLNPVIPLASLHALKGRLWQKYQLSTLAPDELMDLVLGFGEVSRIFLSEYAYHAGEHRDVIAHFHEWMAAAGVPELIDDNTNQVAVNFTTHATLLGRYLMPNEPNYFSERFQWQRKAREYGIETRVMLERAIARKAHVLITDSSEMAEECQIFFDRRPDHVVYNGIARGPGIRHEVFQTYQDNRVKADDFVKAVFYPSYRINTEKFLYFITSGRYEIRNKGFDITLEAAARLNDSLRNANHGVKVILFIVAGGSPGEKGNSSAILESRKRYQDLKKMCDSISEILGKKMFGNLLNSRAQTMPDLNRMIDDELLSSWKQANAQFRRSGPPPVCTHTLDHDDDILEACRRLGLDNREENAVKVIYHPEFMERAKSPFGMDYHDLLKGCNLGIFPSLYEPWGYAAMETALAGTPVIMSDTSGFSAFFNEEVEDPAKDEMFTLARKHKSDEEAISGLTHLLTRFVEHYAAEQYVTRAHFPAKVIDKLCWTHLQTKHQEAYQLALFRAHSPSSMY